MIQFWSKLKEKCPMDISNIQSHHNEFSSLVRVKIKMGNIEKAKSALLNARGELDLMVVSLQQNLYNRDLLPTSVDKILHKMMCDNFSRYLGYLDKMQERLIVKRDTVAENSEVGVSSLSSYANLLKNLDAIIYECLSKAVKEYESIKEDKNYTPLEKSKRSFFYILFQIVEVTLSTIGGEEKIKFDIRKVASTSSIKNLFSEEGQQNIVEEHNREYPDERVEYKELKERDKEEKEIYESKFEELYEND